MTEPYEELLAILRNIRATDQANEQLNTAAANIEAVYRGDYAVACRQLARVERALAAAQDEITNLKRRLQLAELSAAVLACKSNSSAELERFATLNRVYGTDPATEAFFAGQLHKQRKAGEASHDEDRRIKDDIMAWLAQHRASYAKAWDCDVAVQKYAKIGSRTAAKYRRIWERETGFVKPPKLPKKRISKAR